MRRVLTVAALSLAMGLMVYSYDGGYSPGFEPFAHVRLFPAHPCTRSEQSETSRDVFTYEGDGSRPWRLEMTRDGEVTLALSSPPGTRVVVRVGDEINPYLEEAYAGDFNADGQPDFAAVMPTGGCGLASEYCHVAFFLSDPSGYRVVSILTMGFGLRDLVDLKGDRTCQIVHRAFVYGERGADGRTHNYWVYHFLGIRGGTVQLLGDPEPRWIMYAGKTNHNDTRQLSREQKDRLWAQSKAQVFVDLQ